MTTSNLTGSDVNGVYNITATSKPAVDGGADTEGILITGSGLLQASKTNATELIFTNCQIFLNNAGNTGGNPSLSAISYNGDDTDRADNGNYIRFRDCQIIHLTSAARRNVFISEMTRTDIIEQDDGGELFVYTQPNATLNTVNIRGVNTWEVAGAFTEAFAITLDTIEKAYLNWEAGRLDFYGLGVINKPATAAQADAWFGTGNTGNNSSWQWNNQSTFDAQKMYMTSINNRYYDGVTISWEFVDNLTGSPIADIKVKVKDDFPGAANSGTMTERAEYLTNASGHIKGTWNSNTRTTVGGDIDRNTHYMVRNAVERVDTNADLSGTKTYPVTVITGGQGDRGENYEIDVVLNEIEVKGYLYQAVSGYLDGDAFVSTVQIGVLASDQTVDAYQGFNQILDEGITQATIATVNAYTELETLDKAYDRIKAEWYGTDAYPLPTFVLGAMDLGAVDLIVDGTAAAAYAFAAGDITISTDIGGKGLAVGTTITAITTTGVVTFQNSALLDGLTINGDVVITSDIDLTNVTINGDLNINVAATTSMDFSNVTVTGSVFNDAASNTLTINSLSGSSLTAGDAGSGNGQTNIIQTVPIKVTVKDITSGDVLQGARVYIKAAAGGDLAGDDVVTITRVTTTATVANTAHGMVDGEIVTILGAIENEYNGTHTITYIDANSYSYTVAGSPTTPATGTILASAQLVNELTDALGEVNKTQRYTNDQPVVGSVRKSSP